MNTDIVVKSSFLDGVDIQSNQCVLKITGELTNKTASEFCENLLSLDKRDMEFIPVMIHSGGGDVDALLMVVQTMEQCVTPIATICMGHALSAAAIIFSLGSNGYRYMGPHSYLMFHECSMGIAEGKSCDIHAVQSHFSKLDKSLNKKVEKHIGLENGYFDKHGHVDTYMTAKDCLKDSIANHVGYPLLSIRVELKMSIDVKKGVRQEIDNSDERPYKYTKFVCQPVSICDVMDDE